MTIEKAGTMTASGGSRVSLPDALLGLLEPSSSTSWECPYTRRTYNMSQINWIMAEKLDAISTLARLPIANPIDHS